MLNFIAVLIVFVLSFPSFSHATESYIKYGISPEKYFHKVKTLSFGYTDSLLKINRANFFSWTGEAGFWSDIGGNGRLSSFFGSLQGGVEITASPFKVSSSHGIGAITNTDVYLGSNFQFVHDLCLGLIDDMNRATVSACAKHISNGGINTPNVGRDFVLVKIGIPY